MDFPSDLRYTKDHEWVRLDDDGLAVIGITDYAQGELGDIVFVELEAEGTEVDAESALGTVEAVKTVSELFAPIAGTIEAINEDLDGAPESVNGDPYGDGCADYIPSWCGGFDDADFDSMQMCCACAYMEHCLQK